MVTEEIQRLAFRTQRLGMRCSTLEDAPAIHRMQTSETVMKYLYDQRSPDGFASTELKSSSSQMCFQLI